MAQGQAAEEAVKDKIREELKTLADNFVCDIPQYGKDRDRTIKVRRWDELQADKKQEFEDVRVLNTGNCVAKSHFWVWASLSSLL
jgi:hypothetical protein